MWRPFCFYGVEYSARLLWSIEIRKAAEIDLPLFYLIRRNFGLVLASISGMRLFFRVWTSLGIGPIPTLRSAAGLRF